MAKPFTGTINVDIRDSEPDWTPFEPPVAPADRPEPGGTIRQVRVNVSGQPYVDLEREAVAMMARE